MRFTKPFNPSEDSYSLNDSIYYKTVPIPKPFEMPPTKPFIPEKPLQQKILSEKTGYNYISVLKEFSDQVRSSLEYEYTPQINSFLCICTLNKVAKGQGRGSNKQEAKKNASKEAIQQLATENRSSSVYFSRYILFEELPTYIYKEDSSLTDVQDKDNGGLKEQENEAIILLNQYCQQNFQINPSCDYEPCNAGFRVVLKCGVNVEIAEGPSKKLARQNAAKLLCEKFGIVKGKMALIDEVSMKVQRIMGTTPSYSQMTLGNDIIIRITAGNLTEEGIGRTKKDAKIQACEKLLSRLNQTQTQTQKKPPLSLSKNSIPFTNLKEQSFKEDNVLEGLRKEYKDISSDEEKDIISLLKLRENNQDSYLKEKECFSNKDYEEDISKENLRSLKDITNKATLNPFQEQFLNYAKEKLSITTPNLNNKPQSLAEKIRNYDQKFLKPSDKDIAHLESLFQTVHSLLIPHSSSLAIERFLPVGSFVNSALRKYKFEMDVLAIYEPLSSITNPLKHNKELCEKLKDHFLEEAENKSIEDKYNAFVNENRGTACLQITETDSFKNHQVFKIIRIIPIGKTSPRLQMGLRINMEMMRKLNTKSKGLKEDLAVEKRVLRMIRDNRWPEMKSEVLDLVLFNITRKFSEIDIIRNLRRFFEFIALGGFTCNKGDNEWFWDEFPTSFCDFIRNELKKEFVVRLEEEAKEIITKGGLESLFPKELKDC